MSTGLACVSEKFTLWNADGLWDSLNIFRYLIWVLLLLCPKRVQCIPFSTHFHEQYAFFQIWSAKTQWFFHPVRIEDDRFVQSTVFEDLESWGRRCWDAPLHPFTAGNQLHLQIIYPAPIWMDTEMEFIPWPNWESFVLPKLEVQVQSFHWAKRFWSLAS